MGITEKMCDGITTVIEMNDKVGRLSATVKSQQDKIVALTKRLAQLAALIEIGLSRKTVTVKRLGNRGGHALRRSGRASSVLRLYQDGDESEAGDGRHHTAAVKGVASKRQDRLPESSSRRRSR